MRQLSGWQDQPKAIHFMVGMFICITPRVSPVAPISFDELGTPEPKEAIQVFAIEKPSQTAETITGTIDILDIRFGSLWTNIPHTFFKQWQVQYNESLLVSIYSQDTLRYQEEVRFGTLLCASGRKRNPSYMSIPC